MTNIKATKRALGSSVLALFLCFAMLLGTTFAWFTDSVTSANNIITAGNLDVELKYKKVVGGTTADWAPIEDGALFNNDTIWEPGHAEVVYLEVSNLGTLDLKYQLSINVVDFTYGTDAKGNPIDLREHLVFKVIDITENEIGSYNTYEAATTAAGLSKGLTDYNGTTTPLEAGNKNYVAVIVYMPETVGNEANSVGLNPSITLGVNLFATQYNKEADSFGSNYDEYAPIVSVPVEVPSATPIAITLKGSADTAADEVSVALPESVVDKLPDDVTEIALSVSKPVVDATANTITFDSIEIVDQNGKIVELSNLGLTEKITVTLPAQDVFAPGETVVLYHDGEYVATAVVNTDTTISYEVEHLCEVSVGAVELPEVKDNIVEIGTAAELFGFAQSVNAGMTYEGITVVLTKDIDLKNALWTPIGSATQEHGFMGNFDGNGKTISNLYIKGIELDSDGYAYAGFFGITEGAAGKENVIKNLTIKNVTIDTTGHIVAAAIAYPYYTTVENITVCGNIAIKGGDYTSGVLAYTRRCYNASNLTVNGNEGSYIIGGNTVGGVISDIQTNDGLKANYSNFAVSNIYIKGNKCVGGISGIIGGQTLDGATVENVALVSSDAHVGIVAGSYDSKPTINNVTYSKVSGTTAIAGTPYSTKSNAFVTIDGVEYVGRLSEIENMLAEGKTTIRFACDINGDLTIVQQPGVKITIDGMGHKFNGVITVDGKSGTYTTAGLTIKNVNFAAESISADACIRLGDGTDATRYTCNVTVENCTFDVPGAVGVKSYTGGDKNVTITGCTATANAHSLAQLKGVDGVLVDGCEVYSKNGINFNNSTNVTVKNSIVNVKGYAVRFGESSGGSGAAETYTIEKCALTSACEEAGDAVIILRGTADNATLTVTGTTIDGATKIANTAVNAKVYVDGFRAVTTADELVAGLDAKEDVIFFSDITMKAKSSNGYGATGIVVNGQVVNGNGYTLKVTNAGTTWDSAIFIKSGSVNNITVAGAMRGIFTSDAANGDIYLDNVTFKDVIYTFNSDGNSAKREGGLYISNCNMNGWTSFSDTHTKVVFTKCAFAEGSGYKFARPYNATEFIGCSFAEGYTMDPRAAVTFENCTIGGVALTAENLSTLVTSNIANASVK